MTDVLHMEIIEANDLDLVRWNSARRNVTLPTKSPYASSVIQANIRTSLRSNAPRFPSRIPVTVQVDLNRDPGEVPGQFFRFRTVIQSGNTAFMHAVIPTNFLRRGENRFVFENLTRTARVIFSSGVLFTYTDG